MNPNHRLNFSGQFLLSSRLDQRTAIPVIFTPSSMHTDLAMPNAVAPALATSTMFTANTAPPKATLITGRRTVCPTDLYQFDLKKFGRARETA